MWKSGGCRVDYDPPAVGGEAKSMSNQVSQDYAQKLLDHCGDGKDGSSSVGVSLIPYQSMAPNCRLIDNGHIEGKLANSVAFDIQGVIYHADDLQGGCVCVHSTQSEAVCDCGSATHKFGDCSQGYEIGT